MAILGEILIAILGVVVSTEISEIQMKASERRTARETFIRNVFQAACDRYNVTISQLDQLLSSWDLSMSKIADAARGSARLSDATKLYRAYLQAYPEKINQINQIKNNITKTINQLQAKSGEYSSKVERREEVPTINLLGDITDATKQVNSEIDKVNVDNNSQVTAIDPNTLTEEVNKQKEQEDKEAEESEKKQENDWWSSFQPQI